jgi:hypothetical protein
VQDQSPGRGDTGFERVATLRRIERLWSTYKDPAFWLEINPHLTISDRPGSARASALPGLTPDAVERAITQLDTSGFLATPPVVPDTRLAPVRLGVENLIQRGLPPGFVCVYDEFYQCFEGFEPLFDVILGPGYLWLSTGFWPYHVPAGAPSESWFRLPGAPHRDSLGPDPFVVRGDRPSILTLWLALTDVTSADSCIYVVPKYCDKRYLTSRSVDETTVSLQHVRAVPVPAGSLLAWSTHLAHWGSHSTPDATGPRLSATMYFQRADVPLFDPSVFDVRESVPLDTRLRWILCAMDGDDVARRLP